MFSQVLLKSRFLNAHPGTINLPHETQGKTMFGELQVGTEFLWKTERLSAVGTKAREKRKSQKNVKHKNAHSHSLFPPSSPPMHSLTLSFPSSSPIRSHPPSAPSSPSILVDTSTKSVIGAKAGAKRKSQKNVKRKNARSHSLSAPSSPPIL
ncbi:hypothetical protein P5673_015134 [Acropora cervicornis]|uniref:Uncharacterized protein n=1 Tax=Acropora cervicornis TaxID=6130 RepID=A0AAD9V592_ACRCE|nr:hypothetical protein P5673_015134 [Acropora cervicornis]